MIKTILILAIAAAFMVGTSMSLVLSDYEAEAKPKKPKPPFHGPILKPINATLNQLGSYEEQLALIHFKFVETADGIGTSPGYTDAEIAKLFDELEGIEFEAESIRDLAEDTKNNIPTIKIP